MSSNNKVTVIFHKFSIFIFSIYGRLYFKISVFACQRLQDHWKFLKIFLKSLSLVHLSNRLRCSSFSIFDSSYAFIFEKLQIFHFWEHRHMPKIYYKQMIYEMSIFSSLNLFKRIWIFYIWVLALNFIMRNGNCSVFN